MLALLLAIQLAQAGDPEAGQAIYTAKCQACHGTTGHGDGPAARALPKPPRDFSQPSFWDTMDDAKLAAAISGGRPGTTMRGFQLTETQLADLTAYLKTFPAPPAEK